MAYDSKKAAGVPQKKDSTLLYGAVLLLAIGFFILIGLTFIFAGSFNVSSSKCVGLVTIDGEITTASVPQSLFSDGMPGSEDIAREIYALNKRDDIGSVLFVINSPGGSVVATREIYDAMEAVEKPKVSYYREVAASGGLFVSMATEYIVAEPDTLTGSIGVITASVDASGLLDKIGVNMTNIAIGTYKDIGAYNRPMTEQETAMLKEILNETYQEFRTVVLKGREGKMSEAQLDSIADGRILSGRQAKAAGLVDQLGNKKDALRKAAELGGWIGEADEEPTVCVIKITAKGTDGSPLGIESFFTKIWSNLNRKDIGLRYG